MFVCLVLSLLSSFNPFGLNVLAERHLSRKLLTNAACFHCSQLAVFADGVVALTTARVPVEQYPRLVTGGSNAQAETVDFSIPGSERLVSGADGVDGLCGQSGFHVVPGKVPVIVWCSVRVAETLNFE